MRNFARRCGLVAGFDLREYLRERPRLNMFLQPLLFLGFVMILPSVIGTSQSALHAPLVAYEGTGPAAAALAHDLRVEHVRIHSTTDALVSTRLRHADVGIVVTDPLAVRVIVARTREKSRNGYAAVSLALAHIAARRASQAPLRVNAEEVQLNKSPHGQALTFSRFLPFYVLGQLMGVIAVCLTHFTGSAAKRATEPLLVLPYSRREIVFGKAAFAASSGLLLLGAMFVPLIIFVALPFRVAGVDVSLTPSAIVGLIVGGLLLLPALAAIGVLVGAAARTPNAASVAGGLVSIVPIAIAGGLTFFVHGVLPSWLLAFPIVGHQELLSEAARSTAPLWHFAALLLSTAVWSVLLLVPAGYLLSRDRAVLRPAD